MRLKKIDKILLIFLAILLLVLAQNVYADLTGTEGLAIDLSSAGAGTDFTITFDPTELLGNRTWGDASTDTIVWTWNRATGTAPTITFNSGSLGFPAITLVTPLAHEYGGIEADISAIADGGILVGTGAGTMAIRASFMTAGAAGFVKHELGGLEGDFSGASGILAISGGSTSEVDAKSELEAQIADVADFAEADGDTYSNAHDYSAATVTLPKRTKNDDKRFSFNIVNPNGFYDIDTQFCFEPNLPANITITEVTITCDADPATELDWDLKYADAFIGLANATLIVAIDTTNGTTDIDAGWGDNTVVATKALYIEFAADPDSNITQVMVKIRYDYD